MGGCIGVNNIYEMYPELQPMRPTFDALSICSNDIAAFYKKFKIVDVSKRDFIHISDIFDYLPFEENTFLLNAFTCFKDDESETLDFREFVLTIWNYCTIDSPADMASFAYDLYNTKDTESGKMEKDTIMLIAKHQFEAFYDHPFRISVFTTLESMQFFAMSRAQFINFTISHPALMYSALEMLKGLRKWFFGELYWADQIKKRDILSKGKFLNVGQLREVINAEINTCLNMQMNAPTTRKEKCTRESGNTKVIEGSTVQNNKRTGLTGLTTKTSDNIKSSGARKDKSRKKKQASLPPVSSPTSTSTPVVPFSELSGGRINGDGLFKPSLDAVVNVAESRATISRARRRSRYSLPARPGGDQVHDSVEDEDAKWIQKAANNITATNENYWDKAEVDGNAEAFSRGHSRRGGRQTFPCDDAVVVPVRKYNLTLTTLPSFNRSD